MYDSQRLLKVHFFNYHKWTIRTKLYFQFSLTSKEHEVRCRGDERWVLPLGAGEDEGADGGDDVEKQPKQQHHPHGVQELCTYRHDIVLGIGRA